MKLFYIRWGGILALGLLLAFLGSQRYDREVATLSPEKVFKDQPAQTVRVQGRIKPGTLKTDPVQRNAVFQLEGKAETIPVHYEGDELENLRELKIMVLIGRWNPAGSFFESRKTALTPNYGFILAAYLAGLIPLALFLFNMERKVAMLYALIKQEKQYQPDDTP